MNDPRALARRADRPEDFRRLGLSSDRIAPFEDGARTDGGPGSYEWWYVDATLDDGTVVVVTFFTKPMLAPQLPLMPFVNLEITRPGQPTRLVEIRSDAAAYASSIDTCDVRIGANSLRGDLHRYNLHIEHEDVILDLRLTGQVPAWRPATGHFYFGPDDDGLFAWLPSVPQGAVEATLTEHGETSVQMGIGYHDHNWGDTVMASLMHHWYWGRAQAGPYSIIASTLYAEQEYGGTRLPIFLLARDGQIIADDASAVTLSLHDIAVDEHTGMPFAARIVYTYADAREHYRVTFQHEETINASRFAEIMPEAAAAAGLEHSAYVRVRGTVQVERLSDGEVVETVADPGVWELMHFGHVDESEHGIAQ
jgi:hypothetical protein